MYIFKTSDLIVSQSGANTPGDLDTVGRGITAQVRVIHNECKQLPLKSGMFMAF